MSLIKLSGNPSGTGAFTIAAPNGNTDRTLTLPDATGTVVTANASGNVGIGTSSPARRLDVSGSGTDGTQVQVSGTTDSAGIKLVPLSGDQWEIQANTSSEWFVYNRTDSSHALMIDGIGRTLIGASSFPQNTGASWGAGSLYVNDNIFVRNNNGTGNRNVRIDGFTDEIYFVWANGNTDNNSIKYAFGGTAWVNTSDETLKDIIEPITNAASKVCSLRSVIGKYKNEADGVRHPFLIAQDVQAVLPEAVYTNKSRVEGEPDTLGVGYTDVIPLLVAAIKEQQAQIEELKAEVAALKGASA